MLHLFQAHVSHWATHVHTYHLAKDTQCSANEHVNSHHGYSPCKDHMHAHLIVHKIKIISRSIQNLK